MAEPTLETLASITAAIDAGVEVDEACADHQTDPDVFARAREQLKAQLASAEEQQDLRLTRRWARALAAGERRAKQAARKAKRNPGEPVEAGATRGAGSPSPPAGVAAISHPDGPPRAFSEPAGAPPAFGPPAHGPPAFSSPAFGPPAHGAPAFASPFASSPGAPSPFAAPPARVTPPPFMVPARIDSAPAAGREGPESAVPSTLPVGESGSLSSTMFASSDASADALPFRQGAGRPPPPAAPPSPGAPRASGLTMMGPSRPVPHGELPFASTSASAGENPASRPVASTSPYPQDGSARTAPAGDSPPVAARTRAFDAAELLSVAGFALPFPSPDGSFPQPARGAQATMAALPFAAPAAPHVPAAAPAPAGPSPAGPSPVAPGESSADARQRVQSFTLAQYARLCAELRANPDEAPRLRLGYGIDGPAWTELHTLWQERFRADATLRFRWEKQVEQILARIRAGT